MAYSLQEISSFLNEEASLMNPGAVIEHLVVDSRKVVFPDTSLFFALHSSRRDGAAFIDELYEHGVRSFVVRPTFNIDPYTEGNFIIVSDPLDTLQRIASYHRAKFNIPVIGITGSNGKTMVKEWLFQLLHNDYNIVRSPKSYNSQIGVPLSVWQMSKLHTLAIFEAGISQPGEMKQLEKIIRPTLGVLTNIGEAHAVGFLNATEKALEKSKLFYNSNKLIYCKDTLAHLFPHDIQNNFLSPALQLFSWSRSLIADLTIGRQEKSNSQTTIYATNSAGEKTFITIPFLDDISIDNAITCWCIMVALGYKHKLIYQRMLSLTSVEMRMQMKQGINNCVIINDSYSNDLSSLEIALTYLRQQSAGRKTTVILSDILQSGLSIDKLVSEIALKLESAKVDRAILIGPEIYHLKAFLFNHHTFFKNIHLNIFASTDDFLAHINTNSFHDEVILIKGARIFEFERIDHFLEEKTHQTLMEINLNAMVHNLKQFQHYLNPSTKVMAMVKAFSYGSGSAEIARVLQFNKVDYLAVAYTDEGVELRRAGIHMPIMVMNPEEVTFDALVDYNLEPELYSFNILNSFYNYVNKQGIPAFPIHIKIDTGMHRLGFEPGEVDELAQLLKQNSILVVKSVFTHLVASEDESLDQFTQQQFLRFQIACTKIEKEIGYSFIKHLSNSAAVFRHPALQCNMIRLGIGLYGVDTSTDQHLQLLTVATLTSTIAQIRTVKAGESIGYNRKGKVDKDSLIATIRIGYADGFSRRLGNGVGSVFLMGFRAPVIGNVCMDMTMIDITTIPGIKEGDKVEIFGTNISVQEIAKHAETIPYEILTGISQRVKRVYYEE